MTPVSRSAGALLHPVTLTAIAVLLLNDHAFKHAWPDTWWTGKLSDLAWMVFAPPALALVLALVAPRSSSWSNRVFAVAYFGLALLYLAYNFNEPLHDVIMSAFALLTQAESTSPFDPTDAIVIPPALALAAWVWHRGRRPPRLRPVPAMVVLVIAGLASVATSSDADSYGITELAQQDDVLLASTCYMLSRDDRFAFVREAYRSSDGGLTWAFAEENSGGRCSTEQVIERIETSRGLMELRPGEGVFLIQDDVASLEVDTSFVNDRVFQALTYDQLLDRDLDIDEVSVGLFAAEVAPASDNLVIATGHTGVLVGLADGSWEWVSVGPYALTTDSPEARQDQIREFRSVLIIIVAGFLGTTVPLLMNGVFRSYREGRPNATAWLIVGAVPVVLLAWAWVSELSDFPRVGVEGLFVIPYVILILFVLVLVLLLIWVSLSSPRTRIVCIAAGVVSAIAAVTLLNFWAHTSLSVVLAKVLIEVALAAFIAVAFYVLRRSEPNKVSN